MTQAPIIPARDIWPLAHVQRKRSSPLTSEDLEEKDATEGRRKERERTRARSGSDSSYRLSKYCGGDDLRKLGGGHRAETRTDGKLERARKKERRTKNKTGTQYATLDNLRDGRRRRRRRRTSFLFPAAPLSRARRESRVVVFGVKHSSVRTSRSRHCLCAPFNVRILDWVISFTYTTARPASGTLVAFSEAVWEQKEPAVHPASTGASWVLCEQFVRTIPFPRGGSLFVSFAGLLRCRFKRHVLMCRKVFAARRVASPVGCSLPVRYVIKGTRYRERYHVASLRLSSSTSQRSISARAFACLVRRITFSSRVLR